MFNNPNIINSGIPGTPTGMHGVDLGTDFQLTWINANPSLQIQLGYDFAGGTSYFILFPNFSNGTNSFTAFKSFPNGTSYAVRHISSGYIGAWSTNVIPY